METKAGKYVYSIMLLFQVLAGSISVAHEFSKKAWKVRHFYKNKWLIAGLLVVLVLPLLSGVIMGTVTFPGYVSVIKVYLADLSL